MVKEFTLHVFKSWALSFLEILAFFPAILTISIFIQPHRNVLSFTLLLSLFYLFGIISAKSATLVHRNLMLILGLTATCFVAYRMHPDIFLMLPNSMMYCLVYFRGFKSSEASDSEWFPMQIFFVSYLLHFAVIFYFSRVHELNIYLPYLALSAFLTVIFSLLFMNFKQLKFAALSNTYDFKPPAGMIRKNFSLVIVILVLLFSVSYFEQIRKTMLWFWNMFIVTISSVFAYLSYLLRGDQAPAALPSRENLFPALLETPERTVNPLWIAIIEFISAIVLLAIIMAIAFLLLKSLYLLLRAIARGLFRYEKNEPQLAYADETGFVDQKESLLSLNKIRENYLKRLRAIMDAFLKREKKWHSLSGNIEKIRFLYRYSVVKCVAAGYKFKGYLTPTELAQDVSREKQIESLNLAEIASLYSEARYGGKNTGDQKVNEMKEKIINQQDN